MSNLISVIVPCYNAQNYIQRFIDSLLSQTYKNLEVIFINDGSTDDTENVIKSYMQKFDSLGIKVIYRYQKNKGLGGAVNTGLKLFTGDFLCWVDPDDYYEPDSMKVRMDFLINNPQYDVVTSDAYVRKNNDLLHYVKLISDDYNDKDLKNEDQFELLIKENSIFCPGTHMIRTSAFLKAIPDRNIYESRQGQDWQMLLPVYFNSRRYFLNIPLFNYIDMPSSMSKVKKDKKFLCDRYNEYLNIIIKTLDYIQNSQNVDLSKYKNIVKTSTYKTIMHVAIDYNDMDLFKNTYDLKKQSVGLDIKDRLLNIIAKLKIK